VSPISSTQLNPTHQTTDPTQLTTHNTIELHATNNKSSGTR